MRFQVDTSYAALMVGCSICGLFKAFWRAVKLQPAAWHKLSVPHAAVKHGCQGSAAWLYCHLMHQAKLLLLCGYQTAVTEDVGCSAAATTLKALKAYPCTCHVSILRQLQPSLHLHAQSD